MGASHCCASDGFVKLVTKRNDSARTSSNLLGREGALKFLPDNTGRLPSDKYDIVARAIGQGAYGTVRKACAKGSKGQSVALKTIHKAAIPNLQAFVREVEINAGLDHPNIAKLYETFEDRASVYLVFEMCSGGEMFDAIIEKGYFCEGDVAALMVQLLHAVFHCHTRHIAHRDLKPENFMFQDKGVPVARNTLKVIDFGIAKRFRKDRSGATVPMTTKAGTAYYLAPEVLTGKYDEKCDVWSCGVILYILLCGSPPFGGTDDQIFRAARRGQIDFGHREFRDISNEVKDLIRKCLMVSPHKRLTIDEALNHKWLSQPRASDGRSPSKQLDKACSLNFINKLRGFTAANRFKKAALHLVARRLDDKRISRLKDAFMLMDKNGDGQLTLREVQDACGKADLHDQQEVQMLFAELDTDRSGEIGYTEFLAAMIEQKNYLDEEVCREAFSIFDRDNSNSISLSELSEMLADTSTKSSGLIAESELEEVVKIFKDADRDGNGEISFKEFMAMMQAGA